MAENNNSLILADDGKKEYEKGNYLAAADLFSQAAQANGTLFFPINPGAEEASWRRFVEEGVDRFLSGRFDEAYQKCLVDEFDRYLPANPVKVVEV